MRVHLPKQELQTRLGACVHEYDNTKVIILIHDEILKLEFSKVII